MKSLAALFCGLIIVLMPSTALGQPVESTTRSPQRFEFSVGASTPWQPDEFKKYRAIGLSAGVGLSVEGEHATFALLADINTIRVNRTKLAHSVGFGLDEDDIEGGLTTLLTITANVRSSTREANHTATVYAFAGIGLHHIAIQDMKVDGELIEFTIESPTRLATQAGIGVEFPTSRGDANPFLELRISNGIYVSGGGDKETYRTLVLRVGIRGGL